MQNDSKDEILLLALASATFLTLKEKINLAKKLDSSYALALLSIKDISALIGRVSRAEIWDGAEAVRQAGRVQRLLRNMGISYVMFGDVNYPPLLAEIVDAPFMLFFRGQIEILQNRCVSVVGTRRITPDGRIAAHSFACDASRDGCVVVSGLAFGTDEEAHKGTLAALYGASSNSDQKNFGSTVAVLPGGIDTIVPSAHTKLASQILETGGCILSEYAPGVPAVSWRFVQRNRIIAGLSQATVVVQSPPGGGALITADFAVQYDRDVLFHRSAFCKEAIGVSDRIRQQLEIQIARGVKHKSKLGICPEKYLEDGAPVIDDYNDFLRCEREAPGLRGKKIDKNSQLPLFGG